MKEQQMITNRFLVLILVLQAMILLNQFMAPSLHKAYAQIPDAGAQQLEVIKNLQSLNDKTGTLLTLLQSGKLQVQVAKPDDNQK
jgi:hypothetical protein